MVLRVLGWRRKEFEHKLLQNLKCRDVEEEKRRHWTNYIIATMTSPLGYKLGKWEVFFRRAVCGACLSYPRQLL